MPHVAIKADLILNIFGFPITNGILMSWISIVIFTVFAVYYSKQSQAKTKTLGFYLVNSLVNAIYKIIAGVMHKKAQIFFPLLGAYFFFILINNWLGIMPTVGSLLIKPQGQHAAQTYDSHSTAAAPNSHETSNQEKTESTDSHSTELTHPAQADSHMQATIDKKTNEKATKIDSHTDSAAHTPSLIPIFRSGNADLNATLALALITMISIQFFGIKFAGLKGYLSKFFNFKSPIMFFVGFLELISEFARVISFSFRLYGNVLAGEVLIGIVAFLLPTYTNFLLIPFYGLEVMAGFIQALVFTMISTVLINMAITTHH